MLALFVPLHNMLFLYLVANLWLVKISSLVVSFFSLPAIVPDECYNLRHNQTIVKACDWTRFINVPVSTITQLFELIMIRDGIFSQFSVNVDGNVLTIGEVKSLIFLICTT